MNKALVIQFYIPQWTGGMFASETYVIVLQPCIY